MASKLVEVIDTSVTGPLYSVTDQFNQGTVNSFLGREIRVESDGTITAFANHVSVVWNFVSALSAGDIVATIEIEDENGVLHNVAITKVN